MTSALAQLPVEKRWHAQVAPVPIVVALVRRTQDGIEELLLINRAAGPYAGQWALVGGKWDFGEGLAEAMMREVLEETGLLTRFVALRGVVSERVAPAEPGALAAHFLLLPCDLLVVDGVAQEQVEGAVGWFSSAEIEILHEGEAIIPSDYAMIAAFAGAEASVPIIEIEMETTLSGAVRLTRLDPHDSNPER